MAQQDPRPVIVRPAVFPADKEIVAQLFLAYAQSIPVNLDYQNFAEELSGLPGKYAQENDGAIYLACIPSDPQPGNNTSPSPTQSKEQVVGCVGLRRFATPGSCELKRLYLTPASRGLGAAKMLLGATLERARELGYREMLLDTLSSMTAARRLYETFGFKEIESYYESVGDAVFYRCVLNKEEGEKIAA